MKNLLVSVFLVLFIAFAVGLARPKLSGAPACGTYTPTNWVNNGETDTLTLQLGSPLATEVYLPYFFGCSPTSAYSQDLNKTVYFTYFDSASPNDQLVTKAIGDVSVVGDYWMTYDDSQGDGTLAVISSAFYHPSTAGGAGRMNLTYGYDNYQIGSVRAIYDSSTYDLIGDIDYNFKSIRSKSNDNKLPLIANALRMGSFMPEDNLVIIHEQIDFYYNSDGLVDQEVARINSTLFEEFTKYTINISYETDKNGAISQIVQKWGTNSTTLDFTYDSNGLLTQMCQDGCDKTKETYSYDSTGRLTKVDTNGSSENTFVYDGTQIATADFPGYGGLWTFSYN